MQTLKDRINSCLPIAASALMSMLLCLMCVYSEESYTGLEFKPIIEYMLTEKSDIFLNSSSLYAAPLVACSQWNNWFPLFLPVLCAVPFIRELSFEMKGAYRFRVTREKDFSNYYGKTFFRSVLSGSASVSIGYGLFSALVFIYYPHNSDYPEKAIDPNLQRNILDSPLNNLFGSQSEFLYWLSTALSVFACAFLISAVCFLIYIALMNKYKALGYPLIVSFLSERAVTSLWLGGKPKALIFSPRYLMFWTKITMHEWGADYPAFFALIFLTAAVIYFVAKPIFRKRVMN